MDRTIDWPAPRRSRRRLGLVLLLLLAAVVFGGSTALTYYVDALWFDSLGYGTVFWKTLDLQGTIFVLFGAVTFFALYGSFLLLKPARLGEIAGGAILINGQPLKLPVEPVLRLIALALSILAALVTGAGMLAEWPTLALYLYGRGAEMAPSLGTPVVTDPIFARPLTFYLFTLPAWQLITGWLITLALMVCAMAAFFIVITSGSRLLSRRGVEENRSAPWRGGSVAFAALLLVLGAHVYLDRFDLLFEDHGIFTGVGYTAAHVTSTGLLIVSAALVLGAAVALLNTVATPRLRWLVAAVVPAAVCYVVVGVVGWYVSSFLVKPNELVRERPYIANNIELTRQAFALNRIAQHPFPADSGLDAIDSSHNLATLQNIRLWDWHALQDTLRQIQEIRTYYDFPDIDIDRYSTGGTVRQMMLAARELNVSKLPESSRNWINEKLIYTHGYGVTMNPVNGFTPEGLPQLVLSNMPVQSTIPGLNITRPEIYFGELTDTDVYVKTGQQEFNYPQGDTNALTSYEGRSGVVVGGFLRRLLIALDRGDLAKLPFSDDVTRDSLLLMRRNVRERVDAIAGSFLTFDPDPYLVVGEDGRLRWIMDAFTTSDSYPYARSYALGRDRVNYLRNSVKVVIDAYDGATTFYVFDPEDPVINAYRRIFPQMFRDAAEMSPDLRKHVRYPELLLGLQADVYGLYHMTDPEVFYNREDLWSIASQVGLNSQREQTTEALEPNFVLMTLPGEHDIEFVEILPFTPANRNNLIGWIAGRSDGAHYGTAVVYNFPKSKLVDGPLQIEARIDQNPQLSGQLTLWNQQGSHVRRGNLLVIPIGRGLLYAEPIYLQADRSPMPELRLVVLALQDRLVYGPTFEAAMAGLFGEGSSILTGSGIPTAGGGTGASPAPAGAAPLQGAGSQGAPTSTPGAPSTDATLIAGAAGDLASYEHLTAEGKLAEAGEKLEQLKKKLDELQKRRR